MGQALKVTLVEGCFPYCPNPNIFFRLNKSLHLFEMHCAFLN